MENSDRQTEHQETCESKPYWESRFEAVDPETYDFSRSQPSACVCNFCGHHVEEGGVVLDLGCGGGRNAHYLAERGYKVYGVDIAAAAVDLCRRRFARFGLPGTFEQGTFDRIPFPDDFFSAVVCVAAFDHATFDTAQAAIAEVRRVLAPGGMILLTFDPPDTDEEILDEAERLADGTLRFVRGHQAGMLFRRYRDEEIRSLIGERNITSFEHDDSGTRVVVCC